ncbi:MAG TPA: tetratricopeptide repeat protein, partial [Candidatus Polarisedimenticolaceae bacterium]|nr:tetratricopeptide repeat protein [Candidatus Polarisedimenticolaceae bacterium]
MRQLRTAGISTLLVPALLLLLASCADAPVDDGKIPVTTRSDEARALFLEARDLNDRLRGVEALPLLERAVGHDPTFAQGHWLLAQVQPTAAGFFANLEQARVHAASASQGERWLIEATDAAVNGDPAGQGEILQQLVAAFPEDERAHTLLGTYFFGQQRWAEALSEYERAIAIAPEFSPPYNQLGYAYRFTERFAEAESAFRKYIELIPDDPNPYDSYAELLLKLGRYEDSIAQYEKALEQQSTFAAS